MHEWLILASFFPSLFLLFTGLRNLRLEPGHRKKRQHCEMSLIVINYHIGGVRRQRNVIWMWHRVLFAVGHAQRERDAARHRGLNLLSRHNIVLAQRAEIASGFFTGTSANALLLSR